MICTTGIARLSGAHGQVDGMHNEHKDLAHIVTRINRPHKTHAHVRSMDRVYRNHRGGNKKEVRLNATADLFPNISSRTEKDSARQKDRNKILYVCKVCLSAISKRLVQVCPDTKQQMRKNKTKAKRFRIAFPPTSGWAFARGFRCLWKGFPEGFRGFPRVSYK